jgi:hypothetical protein
MVENWQESLSDIFGGYTSQRSLGDAVRNMVFASSADVTTHQGFMYAFERGIAAGKEGDPVIIECVNNGDFSVQDVASALEVLLKFRGQYIAEYEREIAGGD